MGQKSQDLEHQNGPLSIRGSTPQNAALHRSTAWGVKTASIYQKTISTIWEKCTSATTTLIIPFCSS